MVSTVDLLLRSRFPRSAVVIFDAATLSSLASSASGAITCFSRSATPSAMLAVDAWSIAGMRDSATRASFSSAARRRIKSASISRCLSSLSWSVSGALRREGWNMSVTAEARHWPADDSGGEVRLFSSCASSSSRRRLKSASTSTCLASRSWSVSGCLFWAALNSDNNSVTAEAGTFASDSKGASNLLSPCAMSVVDACPIAGTRESARRAAFSSASCRRLRSASNSSCLPSTSWSVGGCLGSVALNLAVAIELACAPTSREAASPFPACGPSLNCGAARRSPSSATRVSIFRPRRVVPIGT